MDGKGSGQGGQGGDGESGRDGSLTYAKRGPAARSEYPGRRDDGSVGSRPGSGFDN